MPRSNMPRSIFETLTTLRHRGLHLLLPRVCSLCEEELRGDHEERSRLCTHCTSRLPGRHAVRCTRCGLRWGDPHHRSQRAHVQPTAIPRALPPQGESQCPLETEQRFPWDSIVCWADYAYPVDGWIHGLKFQRDASLAHGLGHGLASAVSFLKGTASDSCEQVDTFLPIPLSPQRLAKRGFNQAHLIGESFRRALEQDDRTKTATRPRLARLESDWLIRTKHGDALSLLPMNQRQEHVRGAYQMRSTNAVVGKSIGLIDDVMTTGATLSEATRCLKAAGAAKVHVFVAARTA
jgi:ComF family protein